MTRELPKQLSHSLKMLPKHLEEGQRKQGLEGTEERMREGHPKQDQKGAL